MVKLSEIFRHAAENNLAFTGEEFLSDGFEKFSCCAVAIAAHDLFGCEQALTVLSKAYDFIKAMGVEQASSNQFEFFTAFQDGFERVQFERYCWLKFLEQLAKEHEADPELFGDIHESQST